MHTWQTSGTNSVVSPNLNFLLSSDGGSMIFFRVVTKKNSIYCKHISEGSYMFISTSEIGHLTLY